MKELFKGNLIYLQTYKMAKSLEIQLIKSFKNAYFRMSKEARAKERAIVEAQLVPNEFGVVEIQAVIKKKLIEEVDNG